MSAEQAQREPTMEEILASIRRIISEEDQPEASGGDVLELQPPAHASAPAAPAETAVGRPGSAPRLDPPAARKDFDEDLMIIESDEEPKDAEFEVEPEHQPATAPAPSPARLAPAPASAPAAAQTREWRPMEQEALTSDPVATQAAGALSKLMGSMVVPHGTTLDDLVRSLLKPMLKEWLDANLPQVVETEVAKEIDRIRRLAR